MTFTLVKVIFQQGIFTFTQVWLWVLFTRLVSTVIIIQRRFNRLMWFMADNCVEHTRVTSAAGSRWTHSNWEQKKVGLLTNSSRSLWQMKAACVKYVLTANRRYAATSSVCVCADHLMARPCWSTVSMVLRMQDLTEVNTSETDCRAETCGRDVCFYRIKVYCQSSR